MKKIGFIIIACILVMFTAAACNTKKEIAGVKTSDEIQQSSEESTDIKESVKASVNENTGSGQKDSGDPEFELIYNPPVGGSPENIGKIVFASDAGDTTQADYDLFVMDPDGSNKVQLTTFGKFIEHPAWSPEYSRIAYSSNIDNNTGIYIMTADGKVNMQLTFGGDNSDDKFPTWSPDGKYIAYTSYTYGDTGNTANLFVIDIYGKNIRQLTFLEGVDDYATWASWSPVSDVIAFTLNKAGDEINGGLYTIKADGTEMTEILSSNEIDLGDSEPTWSSDGRIIYFISNRSRHNEIWKVDYYKIIHNMTVTDDTKYDDIGLMQISNLYDGTHIDHRPRISPDDKKIVFYGVGQDWNNIGTNLYTINIDGTGLTNITKSIDGSEWPDW